MPSPAAGLVRFAPVHLALVALPAAAFAGVVPAVGENFAVTRAAGGQHEPAVAIDPDDPLHLVVAAMSRERTGDARIVGYDSYDGGRGVGRA